MKTNVITDILRLSAVLSYSAISFLSVIQLASDMLFYGGVREDMLGEYALRAVMLFALLLITLIVAFTLNHWATNRKSK